MLSLRKATWPSQNTALAPPWWKLKISSLGPQLLTSFQLQDGGPSVLALVLLLLMILNVVVVVFRVGSPDTPYPVSCSAHRQKRRVLNWVPSTAMPSCTAGSM